MSDFKPGDRVDVTIKGVHVTGDQGPRDTLTIADEHGAHYVMPPQAAITRAVPAGWPPQAGDLWRDRDGSVWLACAVGDSEVSIITMICAAGAADRSHEQVLARFGPLTLVHREEANEK